MSYFHREGKNYILIGFVLSAILMIAWVVSSHWVMLVLFLLAFLFLVFSIQFFRYPTRIISKASPHEIISPADGKLVVNEILLDGRRQLSIFMSPLNVHANWCPIHGKIIRSEYISGKYLVAWHPKSSTENERHEVDILLDEGQTITVKQIAGAVARRIRCYLKINDVIQQGDELGFIKFGSRVDLLLPADYEVLVSIGDKVIGNKSILAKIS